MSLVVTLRPGEGFTVGDIPVLLSEIVSNDTFKLTMMGREYDIGPDLWTELFPGCQVRSTFPKDPTSWSNRVRAQVDAPAFRIYRIRRAVKSEA